MTGIIIYEARNATAPKGGRKYVDMQVRLEDGREAKMFADTKEEADQMYTFSVGDKVEIDDVSTNGQYVNCKVGALVETAGDREARVGDIDDILALEYALSFTAADKAMSAVNTEGLTEEQVIQVIQNAASTIFIQKSRSVDFIDRAEKRAEPHA